MTYSSYLSSVLPRILWVYLGTHLLSYCNELFPAANLGRVERGKLAGAKKKKKKNIRFKAPLFLLLNTP